jgi:LmbE family N-acetylglucosaminyl deacetylase
MSAYREDAPPPDIVVDISPHFEKKLEAVNCYMSQFQGVNQAGELYPNGQDFLDLVRTQNAHYGTLIRKAYGEPFLVPEAIEIDDLVDFPVFSL